MKLGRIVPNVKSFTFGMNNLDYRQVASNSY